jgi:hypothetical protein
VPTPESPLNPWMKKKVPEKSCFSQVLVGIGGGAPTDHR